MTDGQPLQEAFGSLVSRVTSLFPSLLAAVLILAAGWLLAWLLGGAARRFARRFGVDRAAERSGLGVGLAEARISRPVSELLGRFVFWIVFVAAVLVALDNLGLALSVLPIRSLITYLPQVLGAVLLLLLGALVAQIAGRGTQVALAGLGVDLHETLGRLVRALVLILTVIVAIDQLGLDVSLVTATFTNLVTIVAAGVVLAFALGGRSVARNVLAGFYAREQLRPGDRLVVDGHEGTLESIGTLAAEIVGDEDRYLVPNCRLTDGAVQIRKQRRSGRTEA